MSYMSFPKIACVLARVPNHSFGSSGFTGLVLSTRALRPHMSYSLAANELLDLDYANRAEAAFTWYANEVCLKRGLYSVLEQPPTLCVMVVQWLV